MVASAESYDELLERMGLEPTALQCIVKVRTPQLNPIRSRDTV